MILAQNQAACSLERLKTAAPFDRTLFVRMKLLYAVDIAICRVYSALVFGQSD
jgi:hypothetical protein